MAKSMAPELQHVLQAAWTFCEAAPAVYRAVVVTEQETVPEEQDGVTFGAVVEQLYELFLTLLGLKGGARTGLEIVLDKLIFHTISFMQARRSRCCCRCPAHPSPAANMVKSQRYAFAAQTAAPCARVQVHFVACHNFFLLVTPSTSIDFTLCPAICR
jgi:hypothetical protein